MKKAWIVMLLPALLLTLLATGCYTKLYRPGMDQSRMQQESLYNRYDSTAIDTTLVPGEVDENYYRDDYYGWSQWGRPRRTIWGMDYYGYTPGYYYGYYGYNDYYGTPWWYNYYDPYYPYYPPGSGTPAEPPSKRDGGRRQRPSSGGGSGTYSAPAPPPAAGSPTYNPPSQPSNLPADKGGKDSTDDQKRGGRRGR